MAEIPQLKEAHPILNAQRVSSEGEGFESFAKTLASFAQKEAETAVKLNNEKSDTMYMNSVANAEQAKKDAQIQLLEHPENADKILEHSSQTLNEIKSTAYVNAHDRAKLGKSIASAQGDISLDVAKTSVRQHQLIAAQTHFMNWPDQVAAYKDMLRTDPANAEKMYESMVGSLKGLVSTRVITPVQAANNLKDIRGAVNLEARYHHLLQSSNASAEDYHRVDSSPYNNGKDNTGSPISEDTGWLVDHFASDKSMKNIDANLFDHKLPNMEVYSSITENERNHVDQVQEGIQAADGLIRSGGSYPEVTRRLDALDSHKDSLNVRDNATRIALQDFKNGLKNDYLGTVSSLPAGKSILRDYNDRNAAIGQMAGVSDVEKQRMMNENNDHMVSQMVAYGQAIHAPSDQIKPFPKAVVTAAQQGFNMNGGPGLTLSTLRGYSPQNQVYLANSMNTPKQQVVMQTISFGGKKLADQDALDFIAANQDRSYKEIDLKTEDSVTDNYLKNQISTQIPNAIKIIQAQNDSRNAVTLNGQLIQAGANYAKYLSEKRSQFSFKKDGSIFGSTSNVADAVRLINSSYAPITGADYVFNKNQLDVTQTQADYLAMYAREGAGSRLQSIVSPSNYQQLKNRAPMLITMTPTHDLVAQDPSGNVLFSEHLTLNLMKHIQSEMPRLKKQREKEAIDNSFFSLNPEARMRKK